MRSFKSRTVAVAVGMAISSGMPVKVHAGRIERKLRLVEDNDRIEKKIEKKPELQAPKRR